jgi:SAM-dependent methyltransferase
MVDYQNQAHRYALRDLTGTDYIAFRELAERALISDANVLDLGCGAGRSSRFLKDLGSRVIGIDVSREMIEQANLQDTDGDYRLIYRGQPFPFSDEHFDAIFSSWMILEEGDSEQIRFIFSECNRVLNQDGIGVVIINTAEFYLEDWISCKNNFPENQSPLKSGQMVRARLMPEGVEVNDYFWSGEDYKRFFDEAGFSIVEELRPLGRESDDIVWKDEMRIAPYVIYVIKKKP